MQRRKDEPIQGPWGLNLRIELKSSILAMMSESLGYGGGQDAVNSAPPPQVSPYNQRLGSKSKTARLKKCFFLTGMKS